MRAFGLLLKRSLLQNVRDRTTNILRLASTLGLSMVFDMAKLSGGNVTLANHQGGARVTLRLPLRPVPADAAQPKLVLLVEDMPALRVSVREMLTDQGHQVIEADNFTEALTLSDLPAIDAVLSDIKLPGHTTGVDLLERIADQRPDLRLALMTSLPETHPLRARGAARWPRCRWCLWCVDL